jgi:hypothetical protein
MFTIQYETVNGEHKLQNFDVRSRSQLISFLARYERPIMAVYEQTTPITKLVRSELKTCRKKLSRHAREFAFTNPS